MKKLVLIILVILMLISAALASGTGAGTSILAASSNIVLAYSNGAGGTTTKTAAEDSITDWSQAVKAIHGLLPGTIASAELPAFNPANHLYTGLSAGTDYAIAFPYTNRGNEAVTIGMTASLAQAAARFSIQDSAAIPVAEDAIGTLYVTINTGTALAFEQVTMNCTASITEVASITKNVVSYNAFDNAVNGGGAAYGGIDNIANYYALEVEGYNLAVLSRAAAITAPPSYTGNSTDPVPGAKIKYTIAVANNSSSLATDVAIKDNIPNNCHLYFNDTPTVIGEDPAHTWSVDSFSPTSNASGAGTTVTFAGIYITPHSAVTLDYTVTID